MHTPPHLSPERLAALADDAPTAAERAHLDACVPCAREQRAHVALLAVAATERTRIAPPSSDWTAIAAGLRAEGVMAGEPPVASPLSLVKPSRDAISSKSAPDTRQSQASHVTVRIPRWMLQAAAAVLLVAGGVVVGRFGAASGAPAAVAVPPGQPAPAGGLLTNVASTFQSRDEAVRALQLAESQYQRAAEYLATSDSVSAPAPEASAADVYRARLAAFDGVVAATQQALYAAPADPVINRYYLATSAAREVALKQLSLVAPAGGQINRY